MARENNYAFIDSQNMNLGVQQLGWQLDFARFRRYLQDKYRVTKAFLFIGYINKNRRLYDFLEQAGYEVIYKTVVQNPGVHEPKGNVDAELVLQTMHELCEGHFDKVVIASGGGDFRCLVEYLAERNRLKAIVAPQRRSTSKLLTDNYASYIDFLNFRKGKLSRK